MSTFAATGGGWDVRGEFSGYFVVECTCWTAGDWQSVLPPPCPVHNPPAVSVDWTYATNTTNGFAPARPRQRRRHPRRKRLRA